MSEFYSENEINENETNERTGEDTQPQNGEYSYTYRRADEPKQQGYNPYEGTQYVPPRENFPPRGAWQGQPGGQGAYQGYGAQPRNTGYAPNDQFRPAYGAGSYQPEYKAPKKEKKKGASVGLVIFLCVCTLILSCCTAYFGSWIYRKSNGAAATDTAVLYRSVDTKTAEGTSSVSSVAELVSDSVVEITTEYVTTGYFSFGQYVTQGAGSGVIISDDGYIVTNNHVISDTDNGNTLADKIVVRLRNGEEYTANVIGRDADSDIAVIKIDATGLSAAVWGSSDELSVGEQIIIVGNPLGRLGGTVTTGIISASDREITVDNTKMNLIQTDAAVNPGNSGGGMFNLSGELVGIVNAKSSGTGIEGLGFAIPSADAMDVVEQLLEYGYVKGKVYIGITFYEANSGGWFSGSSTGILYVYSCEKGYNDDVLKYGDQVVSVDGKAVTTKAEVKSIISEHAVGDKVTFTIIRDGRTMDVEVTLYEYVPSGSVSFNN